MNLFRQNFIRCALKKQALCFGQFTTKAGRLSPYFFNAGLFNDGESILSLARFYAEAIKQSAPAFDMLFGPAYKGIILAGTTAMALAEAGQNIPFAYNRKESKDHGEGGVLIGAPLSGRVLIIDDVISAGTSIRESVRLIHAAQAQAVGAVIALDRMERGYHSSHSATQEISAEFGFPVIAIATLNDMLAVLKTSPELADSLPALERYRQDYGVPEKGPR